MYIRPYQDISTYCLTRGPLIEAVVYSYPRHVHTSGDKSSSNKHLKRDLKRERSVQGGPTAQSEVTRSVHGTVAGF